MISKAAAELEKDGHEYDRYHNKKDYSALLEELRYLISKAAAELEKDGHEYDRYHNKKDYSALLEELRYLISKAAAELDKDGHEYNRHYNKDVSTGEGNGKQKGRSSWEYTEHMEAPRREVFRHTERMTPKQLSYDENTSESMLHSGLEVESRVGENLGISLSDDDRPHRPRRHRSSFRRNSSFEIENASIKPSVDNARRLDLDLGLLAPSSQDASDFSCARVRRRRKPSLLESADLVENAEPIVESGIVDEPGMMLHKRTDEEGGTREGYDSLEYEENPQREVFYGTFSELPSHSGNSSASILHSGLESESYVGDNLNLSLSDDDDLSFTHRRPRNSSLRRKRVGNRYGNNYEIPELEYRRRNENSGVSYLTEDLNILDPLEDIAVRRRRRSFDPDVATSV